MKNKLQLYCMGLQDRSDRVRWLLEELGLEYEDHFLKKKAGMLNTPEYRRLNPMGRVPTLIDGDTVIYESGAVCTYLADKYIEKGLAPKWDSKERAEYLQWMFFSVASLECVVARMFTFAGKSEAEIEMIKTQVKEQCEILKIPLNKTLEKQDYLLKSGFSAADIIMAAVIPGASDYLMEPGSPIAKYMERMMARPAAIKVKVFEAPVFE